MIAALVAGFRWIGELKDRRNQASGCHSLKECVGKAKMISARSRRSFPGDAI
jgi:hypothetical protein